VTFDRERADATELTIGIVAARFNGEIVDKLVTGALTALDEHGAAAERIELVHVPGAFELPVVLQAMARTERFDVLVALAAIIRGATPHFEYISAEVARGCAQIALASDIPVGFGVLTVNSWDQALERAGGPLGNKGAEAALSAVEALNVLRHLRRIDPEH